MSLLSRTARRLARVALPAALLLVGLPVAAQAPPPPARPAADAAPRRPLLWRLDDADSRVYLYGSVHALRPGTDVLPGAAAAAYADAEALAFEVDLGTLGTAAAAAAQMGIATDGIPLSKRLGPADTRRLERRIETAGLSLAAVETMEPWLVALVLANIPEGPARFSAAAGADAVLFARATAEGKPCLGLETVADQADALDGLSMKDQLAFLRDALGGAEDDPETGLAALVAAWEAGDADALEALVDDGTGSSADLRQRLLTTRNIRWAPQIEALLAREDADGTPEDVLVVVGAGHLLGPDSVIALLRARGYTVTRVGEEASGQ